MKGIIDEFNKKTGEIREKLAIRNCLDMDRECGKCVQTIFDKSCEVFNNNYKNYFVSKSRVLGFFKPIFHIIRWTKKIFLV